MSQRAMRLNMSTTNALEIIMNEVKPKIFIWTKQLINSIKVLAYVENGCNIIKKFIDFFL